MLAIDSSGSMRAADILPSRIEAAQTAARAFVEALPSRVKLGVVSLAGSAAVVQGPTDSRDDLFKAIDGLALQRGSALGSGIVVALATLLPAAGLRVVREYDTSLPEFRGDVEQLIQAVLNISHNAAQALQERIAQGDAQITLKSRILRQVTFGKQRYRLALELHVMDNGPGVPDSIKDRIFFPLISGREGGSGLGLTLAQTFVQQHHGLIECESEPGRTDFKILIPLP